jgi:hypothetical protein
MTLRDWITSPVEWGGWGARANAWFNELVAQVRTNVADIASLSTDSSSHTVQGTNHLGPGDAVQFGDGTGFPGTWTAYEGVFHEDLASGYEIMSNGTDTYIGADGLIYVRPAGNTGGEVSFAAAGSVVTAIGGYWRSGITGSATAPVYAKDDDTNTGMYFAAADALGFSCGGVVRATLSTSQLKLGTGVRGISYTGTSGTGAANDMGFKWSSPNMYCRVDNAVEAIIGTVSDRRIKKDIIRPTSKSLLARANALEVHEYQAKPLNEDDPDEIVRQVRRLGLIADEVAQVEPSLVPETEGDDMQTVDYAGVVPLLIGAVQELTAKVDRLEARLNNRG